MIGDPKPIRHRAYSSRDRRDALTKEEMGKVIEILEEASSERTVVRTLDEDLWTAFTSLLQGGYIVESPSKEHEYVLTPKGKQYLSELVNKNR